MASTFALFAGVVLLGIGGVVAWYGRGQHQRYRLVTETPTTEILNLREEGPVELEGEVTAEETFRSPIGDEEAVLSAWEIEEWDERGESGMWETRASGVYSRPFAVDDGTGEVRVEVEDHVKGEDDGHFDVQAPGVDVDRKLSSGVSVDGVYCAFEDFPVEVTVPPDRDPPERIAEFVQGEAGVSEQTGSITNFLDAGNKHGERRYYEQTIQPGQEVYLLGEARAAPDATRPLKPEDVVVTQSEDDGHLIVSDQSEASLVEDLGRYRWAYAGAAVMGLTGIALLLFRMGAV